MPFEVRTEADLAMVEAASTRAVAESDHRFEALGVRGTGSWFPALLSRSKLIVSVVNEMS